MDGQGERKCAKMQSSKRRKGMKKENKTKISKQNRCMYGTCARICIHALLYCYCSISLCIEIILWLRNQLKLKCDWDEEEDPIENVCIEKANQVYRIIIGKLNILLSYAHHQIHAFWALFSNGSIDSHRTIATNMNGMSRSKTKKQRRT